MRAAAGAGFDRVLPSPYIGPECRTWRLAAGRTRLWASQVSVQTAGHRCPQTSPSVTITAISARRHGTARMTSRGPHQASVQTAGHRCPQTSLPVTIIATNAQQHGSGGTPRDRSPPTDGRPSRQPSPAPLPASIWRLRIPQGVTAPSRSRGTCCEERRALVSAVDLAGFERLTLP
jgi:hypothetical protein